MAGMEHSQGGQAPQESTVHVFDSESNIRTARVCENGFCDSLEGAVRGQLLQSVIWGQPARGA